MRAGRPEDVPRVVDLLRGEVARGRQDVVPGEHRLARLLARFEWEARSRVAERDGELVGAALVVSRPSPDGVLATVFAAGLPDVYRDMVRWGVDFSRAAGASIVQLTVAKGHADAFERLGLRLVRPWWRMDRSLADLVPRPHAVTGYELIDGTTAPRRRWAEMHNGTFADHWRFVPRGEEEIIATKPPDLCLMAATSPGGSPAAIALGEVERYPGDSRPQPVGLISSVGTLPEHRRHGLAAWLVRELMFRLRAVGARAASLYVDGMNPMRAYDGYRKLGFEVAFEAEVWEATFP